MSREKRCISDKTLASFVCCPLDKGAEAELTASDCPASYAQALTETQHLDAERIRAPKKATASGVVSASIW
ncbi:MAG: hypothetical protein V1800_09230 [Candidatus Latescibacterota bacterium]